MTAQFTGVQPLTSLPSAPILKSEVTDEALAWWCPDGAQVVLVVLKMLPHAQNGFAVCSPQKVSFEMKDIQIISLSRAKKRGNTLNIVVTLAVVATSCEFLLIVTLK